MIIPKSIRFVLGGVILLLAYGCAPAATPTPIPPTATPTPVPLVIVSTPTAGVKLMNAYMSAEDIFNFDASAAKPPATKFEPPQPMFPSYWFSVHHPRTRRHWK